MAENKEPELGEKSPVSLIRHPLRYMVWWWTEKPSTNLANLGIGLLIVAGSAVLAVIANLLLGIFGPGGHVSGYVLIAAACAALAIGALCAWAITRQFYELRTHASEMELELERGKLAQMEPERETLRRMGIYLTHVYNLLRSLVEGKESLGDLQGESASLALCELTQKHLADGTKHKCVVSLWIEPEATKVREKIDAVLEALPGGWGPDFELLSAPYLTEKEKKAFEGVHINSSWLKQSYMSEKENSEIKLYSLDNMAKSQVPGGDVQAFKENGYQSVLATSFDREGLTGYIVVLSEKAKAFTPAEGGYVLWLRHAIELDEVVQRNFS